MTQTPATVRAKNQRWQDAKAERVARTRKQNPRPPWAHPLLGKVTYYGAADNEIGRDHDLQREALL